MSNKRPCITVGLLWHSFSSDNLGVGALSESQVAICEAAALRAGVDLRFIVFGFAGGRNYTPEHKQIRVGSPISLRQLVTGMSSYPKELAQCDLVLDIGEGDSFTDIYGMRRFRVHIAAKLAVLAKRVPLILSPQTIGPFDRWYTRWLAVQIMRRCKRVFARDGLSIDYLHSVGLQENVSEAIDVAFRLPYVKVNQPLDAQQRIGLNVSGLLFAGGYSGHNQFGLSLDYPQLIRDLLTKWCANSAIEVWLIPHVLADDMPRDDDRVAIAILAKEFPKVRVAQNYKSPSEAKGFIAGMDFVTGARMHACIAALSSGVAVVPLAYSRKFNGLFTSLDYRWLADGKAMTNEEALTMITDGFERRAELRTASQLAMGKAEVKLRHYENYLVTEFANCKSNTKLASMVP